MKLEYDAYDAPEILMRIRMASGLSQNAFAKACGVAASSIAHWENRDRFLKITRLSNVANKFGHTINIIVRDGEE